MSIISANKEAKREALRVYEEKLVEMRTVEHNAMNEMLNILRAADGLMTAAQLEAVCTSGISKHEVAGNLLAMKTKHSRYEYVSYFCGHSVPLVNTPHEDFSGKGERIITKGGGKREAVMVELDENGHIIPNSKRKVMLNESKRYGIEKTK